MGLSAEIHSWVQCATGLFKGKKLGDLLGKKLCGEILFSKAMWELETYLFWGLHAVCMSPSPAWMGLPELRAPCCAQQAVPGCLGSMNCKGDS